MKRQLNTVLQSIGFLVHNRNYLKAYRRLEQMRATLVRANMELGILGYRDAIYHQRIREFNQAMIDATKGKWYVARAMETHARGDWQTAFRHIRQSQELARRLLDLLQSGSPDPVAHEKASLSTEGTELTFADGVPLVPEVNPVIILEGSDHDMGYQYAQQLIEIFGTWILERKVRRISSDKKRSIIGNWEAQIREYAPEILRFCEGWAEGASDAGVPMSYDEVLVLWTGDQPPATNYLGRGDGLPHLAPPLCSGVAAWGRATADGRLVTGSSGDHDPTYMVTIVAFPETGNNFVLSLFSATGDVPVVGSVYMMGHPGMNNRGLAYVHHGGELRMVEPKEHWGYGIRRGTSIFHILRFANSAQEAQELELSYPVGDVGRAMGSVGGFYTDGAHAYIMESRRAPIIVREAGVMGETDFLYANNSALHPDSGQAGWMQAQPENWLWEPHGGWHPARLVMPELFARPGREHATDRTTSLLGYMYHNSCERSQFAYDVMDRAVGHVDFEYMKAIYRQSGTVPPGPWAEAAAAYKSTGQWGVCAIGHAGNALVAIMKPDDGDEGIYAVCVGTAARGLAPNVPNPSGGPIYGETNAFWELKLGSDPAAVAIYAGEKAKEYINDARKAIMGLPTLDVAFEPLAALLDQAQSEFEAGQGHENGACDAAVGDSIYEWSRATRAYTRAQVRALQVCQALCPPPHGSASLDPKG
ncbi:MAG TPA: hypothetical protein VLY63_29115 [Anaerolineae bacterium]|nr:hypothetical protein [Anaerolineae bacterium]